MLLGCPAEKMGVELPRGGIDSISMEDITRDVMILSRSSDRRHDAQRRLQEMRTLPAFGRSYMRTVEGGDLLCGRRDGRLGPHSQEAIVVLALDSQGDSSDDASQIAGLISLAKGFDVHEPPMRSIVFCMTLKEGGIERYFTSPPVPLENTVALYTLGEFGGVTGSVLSRTESLSPSGGTVVHLEYEEQPTSSGSVDFHTILSAVTSLYTEIAELQE